MEASDTSRMEARTKGENDEGEKNSDSESKMEISQRKCALNNGQRRRMDVEVMANSLKNELKSWKEAKKRRKEEGQL